MSRRPMVYVVRQENTDGGESPNAFVGRVTVEIRVIAPPRAPMEQVARELLLGFSDAYRQVAGLDGQSPWKLHEDGKVDEGFSDGPNVWLRPPERNPGP